MDSEQFTLNLVIWGQFDIYYTTYPTEVRMSTKCVQGAIKG